jgi:tetratricopeptide (TPR) repeat protein
MNKIVALSLIFSLFLFNYCHKADSEKEKLIKLIHKKEIVFKSGTKKDTVLYTEGRDLINSYNEFITKYPKDTNTPYFLYKAGSLYVKYLVDYKEAIKYFDELYEKFPDYRLTPEALFITGFIYSDYMKSTDKAKEYYKTIIKKYPNNRLAKDCEILLKNLGKSDEELLNEALKRRQENSQNKEK